MSDETKYTDQEIIDSVNVFADQGKTPEEIANMAAHDYGVSEEQMHSIYDRYGFADTINDAYKDIDPSDFKELDYNVPNRSSFGNTVAYKPPEMQFTVHNVEGVKPGSSYMTPDALVENRVASIINGDSPLMQISDTMAKQAGESRGLLNSGSNIAAGLMARTNTALPIATADANNIVGMIARQQQTENQGALNTQMAQYGFQSQNQSGAISGALKDQAAGYDTQARNQEGAINSALTTQKAGYDFASQLQQQDFAERLEQEKNAFTEKLTQMGYDHQKVMAYSDMFANLVDSQIAAMGQIIRTPDQVWDQTKQDAFDNTINAAKEWMASLYGIELT